MTRDIVKSRLIYESKMGDPHPSFTLKAKKVHRLDGDRHSIYKFIDC